MCLATVLREDDMDVIMKDTAIVLPEGEIITLVDLFGESKEIRGAVTLVDLQNSIVKINCK